VEWQSFDLPYLYEVEKYHKDLKRELWVLDVSTDLPVPVFCAVSRCFDPAEGDRIIFGFGAHLDPRIAILRSVTEVNQAIGWIAKYEQFPMRVFENLEDDLDSFSVTLKDVPHVLPDPEKRPRTLQDFPRLWNEDLKEDVVALQKFVEKDGMEVLVLDQTRADIGLPVVKVIVPELRHFYPRFGPGRLYDVPVKLGHFSEPLRETELNPILFFT
jgi:oxazoline/thiazoline synthase